jgi:hypothetical protein
MSGSFRVGVAPLDGGDDGLHGDAAVGHELSARDEETLRASGLTTEEAALEVDRLIWDGVRT